jgi:cytochrome c-type biogenesis protein CcmH/NrfG
MPSHQGAWWNLGRALALQGRLAEADEALLQAIRIDPSNLMSMLIATLRLNLADWNPSASPDLGSQN